MKEIEKAKKLTDQFTKELNTFVRKYVVRNNSIWVNDFNILADEIEVFTEDFYTEYEDTLYVDKELFELYLEFKKD